MSGYDFKSLSNMDFEELTQDLLQAHWKIRLESFKVGADQGIDLRYASGFQNDLIVQCKHFAGSGFSALIQALKDEIPKVERLNPVRYVVVTSVKLSPMDKNKIRSVLDPFVRSPSDIFGAEDLNALLRKFPLVEKRNFKLWLTSTEVLKVVLNNIEHFQSTFEVEKIKSKLCLFVENQALLRARKIIFRHNLVIISGSPGIGKTTLAEMLIYEHIHKEYEPVVVKSNINEAKRIYSSHHKQIFYFDDFLGQTFLNDKSGMIQNNQDAVLTDFMDVIRKSKTARLILTTREHILNNAIISSERLKSSDLNTQKCILTLGDYSFYQKARILYNHLYFSNLPKTYKANLITDEFYIKLIKHRNFNPRIIEWASSYTRISHIIATNYSEFFQRLLDNPGEIWLHAFERQISEAARNALIALLSLGGASPLDELEEAWKSLHYFCSIKYNFSLRPDEFRDALQELEGAFLRINADRTLEFINPSVKDFMNNLMCKSTDRLVDILLVSTKFEQISRFWQIARLDAGLQARKAIGLRISEFVARLEGIVDNPEFLKVKHSQVGHQFDLFYEDRCVLIIGLLRFWPTEALEHVLRLAIRKVEGDWQEFEPDFERVVDLLSHFDDMEAFREDYTRLKTYVLPLFKNANSVHFQALYDYSSLALCWTKDDEKLAQMAFEAYVEHRLDEERGECSDSSELENLKENISSLGQSFNVQTKAAVILIQGDIEDKWANEQDRNFGHYQTARRPGNSTREVDEVTPVRNMFSNLLR